MGAVSAGREIPHGRRRPGVRLSAGCVLVLVPWIAVPVELPLALLCARIALRAGR